MTDFFSVFSGKNRFWHRQFNDKPEGDSVLKRENSVAFRLVVKLKSVTALRVRAAIQLTSAFGLLFDGPLIAEVVFFATLTS